MKLDPKTTALVLIDLQKGILPFAGGPTPRSRCWITRQNWQTAFVNWAHR